MNTTREVLAYMRRVVVLVLVLVVLFSTTTPLVIAQYPWGSGGEEKYPWLDYLASLTTEREVKLVILTRHEQSIQNMTKKVFLESEIAKKLGIVDIQFLYVSAEQWPDYIKNAREQGTSIDIAWGGGPTLFNMLDELGYLVPINPQARPEHYAIMYELSKIPEKIAGAEIYKKDEEGNVHWIGDTISSFGFTVNKDVLNTYGLTMPRTWEDVASPGYARYLPARPLVAIADPEKSTSNLRIYEIILQAKGWEEGWRLLTLIAANSQIYMSSGEVRDAAVKGDAAVAATIDFYGYMAMSRNPACVYVAPHGETIVSADPIAILTTTKHPVHAAAFVAWVLSEYGGQAMWLAPNINRIPINPKTFETPEGQKRPDLKAVFDELMTIQGIEFNETLSSSWVNAIMYYFKATLVNAHDDLQAVWAQIAKAYLDGKITMDQLDYLTRELSKPLKFTDPLSGKEVEFTLDYAIRINPYFINESTKQTVGQALITAWETAARSRYQRVLGLLNEMISPPSTTSSPITQSPPKEGAMSTTTLVIAVVLVVVIVAVLVVLVTRSKKK